MTLLGVGPFPQMEEWPEFAVENETTLMLLDATGRIGYCNSPEIIGLEELELEGKFINGFVPALPLRPRTPGYNVAYVRFYFGEQWKALQVNTSAGPKTMDVRIKAVPMNHSYCFVVLIRSGNARSTFCSPRKRTYPQLVRCSA